MAIVDRREEVIILFNLKGLKQHYESKHVIKEILGHLPLPTAGSG